jgi:hypothetical protein
VSASLAGTAAEAVDVILRDGGTLRLRPPAADDADAVRAFFTRLSPESLALRFHGARRVDEALVAPFLDPDCRGDVRGMAFLRQPPRQQAGELRLVLDDQDPHRAPSSRECDEGCMKPLIAGSCRGARLVSVAGALGNARLTALTGAVLVVLLAVEAATIPFLRPLLSVHIFVGMLLLGPVALKLASTGYRFARYYTRGRQYVEAGPPAPMMRLLVAPVLVLSTLTLFGSGLLLLVAPHRGAVLGLHKASFVVWFGACAIHVLTYAVRTLRWLSGGRLSGDGLRLALMLAALAGGIVVAVMTYPMASPWLHGSLAWDR